MSPITFPGLGLEFQIERVAFSVFGKNIYWYGIIIAFGFLLAVLYCNWRAKDYGLTADHVVDMLIYAVPLSIIGARVYYVVFYLDLYLTERDGKTVMDWGKAIAIWDGGIAIYGAIIAAALTVAVYCKVKKLKFGAFADLGCFGLLIGQSVGRWGNFVNQEAYGGPTGLPWRMGLMVNGQPIEVHPTFLYESLWNLAGFLLLVILARKWRRFDGQIFLSYIAWYGVGRAIIEGLRTDSLYFFGLELFGAPIRTSQVLAVVSAAAAAGLLVWNLKFRHHTPDELFVNQVKNKAVETAGKEEADHGGDDH